MVDVARLLDDLAAESAALDAIVASLDEAGWATATPAAGWTVAHQIAHLTWTDEVSLESVTDPDAFAATLASAAADPSGFVERAAERVLAAANPPDALLSRWRGGRTALAEALAVRAGSGGTDARGKLPWFGTALSPASMVTARLMETWAHGVDVRDALGVPTATTPRLRHIAYLGFRTLAHGFVAHGRRPPEQPVYLALTGTGGEPWTFGDPDAADRVEGPALDFCLLVTQRRHRDDLALVATGTVADEWLDVAQCFAGPPGAGREPTPGPSGAGRKPSEPEEARA
ncbi:MAG TPA: TIGR03084 family metal-binding protein [Micromonosporaceae bacterium]